MSYPNDPWQQPVPPYVPQAPNPYPPAPAPGWPAGYPPPYPPTPPRRGGNRVLITILVVAVLGMVGIGLAPFLIMAKVSSDLGSTIADSTGARTDQILADELDVTFGTFTITKESEYSSPTGKLPVTFKNKGTERKTFNVQIEALDQDGNRIADDNAIVENLAPGQSTTETVFTFTRDVDLRHATFNVAGVSRY